MTNKAKGQVSFETGGKLYSFAYSINALCELEEALGQGFAEVAVLMADPARMRLATVRTMFWAGLREQMPDLTLRDAGKIMTELGLARSMALVSEAFVEAFPEAQASGPLSETARPDGIGLNS